ncbi:hypothetical protein BDR04DRAFT_1121221 [Suillus decipiens]|nr:hypothetical protein BDR04DRAFT_1121221 [Suillus decipiens]
MSTHKLQKSGSTVAVNPSSTSSSQLGHVPDLTAMRTTLQLCLECLDRLNDKIMSVCEEMLEIRTCITELLSSVQPEAILMDSGTMDSSAYLQTTFHDEHQNIATIAPDELDLLLTTLSGLLQPPTHSGLLDQEYGPLESVEVMKPLREDTDAIICQRPSDALLCNTSSHVSYELQPFVPQDGMSFEEKTTSGSSSTLNQRPPPPIVQEIQDKVKCTWPGCSKFVKKESRTRHVNETHLKKVKTVCADCGKGFTRSYMKKDHICHPKCKSS